MKYYEIQEALLRQGLKVFSSQELRRAAGMTPTAVRLWLVRQVKSGAVLPLKKRRGLYCFPRHPPHVWFLANRLCRPSYISLETALSHHGVLPESVYAVTSVTTRVTRTFEALGRTFTFQRIKREAYCGYRPLTVEGQVVLMADKEKALADYLYFVHLKKKGWNDRLRWREIDKRRLLDCLKAFGRPQLMNWSRDVIPRNP